MSRQHTYEVAVRWTGNIGDGTREYAGYLRDHEVEADGVGTLAASSDPDFRGDATRWNPEQLFLASVAECHMLWYLHLANQAGVVVDEYTDAPTATMTEDDQGGGGQFTSIRLRPRVTISAGDPHVAETLHDQVGSYCFIARSLNVAIGHVPTIDVAPTA